MRITTPILAALVVIAAAVLGAQTYAPYGMGTAMGIALGNI